MNMQNLFRAAAIAAVFSAMSAATSAQTLLSSANVDVKVTLASKCRWDTSAPTGLTVNFGNYTAFQPAAQPGSSTTMTVECTRGFGGSPSISWDTGDAKGVIAGLQYTLSLTGGTATPGAAASTTSVGSGDTIDFVLSGSMPALQAGDDQTGQVTQARTVTLSF
jgi:hypothetical protein